MEHERPHLNRAAGDVERGVADVLQEHPTRNAAPHAAAPLWLTRWEDRRPVWLTECIAEMIGVFFYVYSGVGASAAFYFSTVNKQAGFGNLLTVGLAYGLGIAMAINVSALSSGGHLSPSYTIAFAVFKGFPLRKVPRYILSQFFGAFIAVWCVYGQYKQEFVAAATLFKSNPETNAIFFSSQGPAGVLALFPNPGQQLGWVFMNEFIVNILLSILVFSCLDASNIFSSFTTVPFLIGAAYATMIWAFAGDSLALNSARDLGGRFVCASVYGSQCFTASSKYTAIAALTNIPAALIGAAIQTIFLSDSARTIVHSAPPPSMRVISRNPEMYGDAYNVNGQASSTAHEQKYTSGYIPQSNTNGLNGTTRSIGSGGKEL